MVYATVNLPIIDKIIDISMEMIYNLERKKPHKDMPNKTSITKINYIYGICLGLDEVKET